MEGEPSVVKPISFDSGKSGTLLRSSFSTASLTSKPRVVPRDKQVQEDPHGQTDILLHHG